MSKFWKKSAPGSEAAGDKWLLRKKNDLLAKSSAPGSEAARDKWLLQKNDFWKKVLPQAAKLPRTSGLLKKMISEKKKQLPQATKLPGTSGFFKKG